MNFEVLQTSSLQVKIHLVFALIAFVLGGYILFARKGDKLHKALGKIWAFIMLVVSVSSFWIKEIMPNGPFFGFSPIHLLSIFTISQIILGVYFAKTGQILKHKIVMISTYFGGLIIAGGFTFYPGRMLYNLFF